jgi:hypothetical protein
VDLLMQRREVLADPLDVPMRRAHGASRASSAWSR